MGIRRILFNLVAVFALAAMGLRHAHADSAPGTPEYVAMGSSYAAGPGILPTVAGSPARCARSTQNYAHVLASERHLSLVDVSCSGATTVDVIHGGQFDLPAQLDAVTAATQLVTVTIGGNDVYFMANLIAMSCSTGSAAAKLQGWCEVHPDAQVEARFATLAESLRQVLAEARHRSPKVRVVFVNYFTVLPEQGTCARVALTSEQADHMRLIATRLADITRQVALAGGADLLDVGTLSRPHNACAADPWVVGAHPDSTVLIPPFHPNPEAMHAVGEALNSYLRDHPAP